MFHLRRTFAIKLGVACLAFNMAGCHGLFRPLSVFHHKRSACKPTRTDCAPCAAPVAVGAMGSLGGWETFDPTSSAAYGDPIQLETSPLLMDGQVIYGDPGHALPEGAEFLPYGPGEAMHGPPAHFAAPPFPQPQPGPMPQFRAPAPTSPPPMSAYPSAPIQQFQPPPTSAYPSAPIRQFQSPPTSAYPSAPIQQFQPPAPPALSQPQASLLLPPPAYHVQVPVTHPSPPPRKARSAKEPAPLPPELAEELETRPEPEPVAPPKPIETPEKPVPDPPEVRPSGLTHEVLSSPAVADVGQEVRFEIRIRNQGDSPIEKVDFTATLSANLQPKVVSPEGSGMIDGQRIVFEPLQPLAPMELKYYVTAAVVKLDGGVGKISVEVSSSLPMADPVTKEATVTIGDENARPND